ncbi:MAG: leukotriene A4 hydrolase C-terminal domain-containing protein [Bacteroidetes bacterium]|nr:leukotriene A4 hydrolase C-terminal domain-containing protein [Bacteroidota bacterium]
MSSIYGQTSFNEDTVARNKLLVRQWIYEPGLPSNYNHTLPLRFMDIDSQRVHFENENSANSLQTNAWSTHEWLQFLRKLSRPLPLEKLSDLDYRYKLSTSSNCEIADEWYRLAIASNYEKAYPHMEHFLGKVGRKKFLEPLYMDLIKTEKGRKMASCIFEKSRSNYHPLTAAKIEKILQQK